FGARQASGFKRFLDTLTWPLLAPFKGLMPDPAVGSMQLMLSYIVALVVFLLLHMAVNGLLRLFAERKSTI
ncbi:MAG: YggT family protein, partial [Vicinamibacteria bacterium]|nr:YggT family protein [Vicinamibacteria bacterium]